MDVSSLNIKQNPKTILTFIFFQHWQFLPLLFTWSFSNEKSRACRSSRIISCMNSLSSTIKTRRLEKSNAIGQFCRCCQAENAEGPSRRHECRCVPVILGIRSVSSPSSSGFAMVSAISADMEMSRRTCHHWRSARNTRFASMDARDLVTLCGSCRLRGSQYIYRTLRVSFADQIG